MTELSNAVTVLIARMESHPEDFDLYGAYTGKFTGVAEALYGLCGMDDGIKAPLWFLSDTDKEALRDAWAKLHYGRWEKDIMEKVFDEDYYKRQEEAKLYEQQMKQQMYQQQISAQNARQGQIHPLHNSAINSSGSGFLGNIFGGSR